MQSINDNWTSAKNQMLASIAKADTLDKAVEILPFPEGLIGPLYVCSDKELIRSRYSLSITLPNQQLKARLALNSSGKPPSFEPRRITLAISRMSTTRRFVIKRPRTMASVVMNPSRDFYEQFSGFLAHKHQMENADFGVALILECRRYLEITNPKGSLLWAI